jgi:hypothetical protein
VMVRPGRFELPTFGLGNRRSILLSYGRAGDVRIADRTRAHSRVTLAVAQGLREPGADRLPASRQAPPQAETYLAGPRRAPSGPRGHVSSHRSHREHCERVLPGVAADGRHTSDALLRSRAGPPSRPGPRAPLGPDHALPRGLRSPPLGREQLSGACGSQLRPGSPVLPGRSMTLAPAGGSACVSGARFPPPKIPR